MWAAASRAIGAREPDPAVRNPDWLAERLLGPEERALLGDHPLAAAFDQPYEEACRELEVVGAVRTLIPRTRFIDERLQAAIADGATQVVILGAGFDSRAYRFAELLKGARVFEVDRPGTQQLKIRRVHEGVGAPPSNLTYVSIDFRHETPGDVLARSGYKTEERTFFIWEGVTMYLPAAAVHETLRWIGSDSAPGSAVVFDYTYQAAIDMFANLDMEKVPEAARQALLRFKRLMADEPWIFGLPEDAEKEFLEQFGLTLRFHLGMNSAEAVVKYLTRADGSILGSVPASERQGYSILMAAR
ncbi:MAG: SAM-dependent methyltransferase [Bryobacteraceae bacterium]